jgi:hypothetical protein
MPFSDSYKFVTCLASRPTQSHLSFSPDHVPHPNDWNTCTLELKNGIIVALHSVVQMNSSHVRAARQSQGHMRRRHIVPTYPPAVLKLLKMNVAPVLKVL